MNSFNLYAVTITCSQYVCCNMMRGYDDKYRYDRYEVLSFCQKREGHDLTDLLLDPVKNSFHRFTELSPSTATVCKVSVYSTGVSQYW
jgi:hypothetical protein